MKNRYVCGLSHVAGVIAKLNLAQIILAAYLDGIYILCAFILLEQMSLLLPVVCVWLVIIQLVRVCMLVTEHTKLFLIPAYGAVQYPFADRTANKQRILYHFAHTHLTFIC